VAAKFTLGQAITDARYWADVRGGTQKFTDETEIKRLLNLKARELYERLVDARGMSYYATEGTISIVPDVARYDLPDDFMELSSVTLEWGSQDHELVDPIMTERQRTPYANSGTTWGRYESKVYKLRASQIEFLPTPTSNVTCRLQYVPTYQDLVDLSDEFDGVNGWEKMITVGVALEMMVGEKRPSPALMQIYQEQLDRIEHIKNERDAEVPKQIIDVYPDGRRGARLLGLSPWDDTFDAYFGK
jgi:hypothetical protein